MNWKPSPTEFATIVDGNGKQVADFGSPQLSEGDSLRNMALGLASPYMLATLQRAEFLLRRISEGDHRALEKAADCADQCRGAILRAEGRAA